MTSLAGWVSDMWTNTFGLLAVGDVGGMGNLMTRPTEKAARGTQKRIDYPKPDGKLSLTV